MGVEVQAVASRRGTVVGRGVSRQLIGSRLPTKPAAQPRPRQTLVSRVIQTPSHVSTLFNASAHCAVKQTRHALCSIPHRDNVYVEPSVEKGGDGRGGSCVRAVCIHGAIAFLIDEPTFIHALKTFMTSAVFLDLYSAELRPRLFPETRQWRWFLAAAAQRAVPLRRYRQPLPGCALTDLHMYVGCALHSVPAFLSLLRMGLFVMTRMRHVAGLHTQMSSAFNSPHCHGLLKLCSLSANPIT